MEVVLMVISLIVYFRLLIRKNAWGWIVIYWAALFAKNMREVMF